MQTDSNVFPFTATFKLPPDPGLFEVFFYVVNRTFAEVHHEVKISGGNTSSAMSERELKANMFKVFEDSGIESNLRAHLRMQLISLFKKAKGPNPVFV